MPAGTVQRVYPFQLADLAAPSHLDVLLRLFTDPNSLRPDQTTARLEWLDFRML